MKILVVDDNQDLAAGLADMLELEGHEVAIELTVANARSKFSAAFYDLVLLDMKLPDGNGLDLFYEFHALSPESRIILMTGYRIEQLLQQLVDEGVVGILRKPIEMDQVLTALINAEPHGIVLIGDDDREMPSLLAAFLEKNGRNPLVVRDSGQFRDMLENGGADVLILDLQRPILCGAEAYMQLKKKGRVIPTIIISGLAPEEDNVSDVFRSLSVTNCLFKPFNPQEVIRAIDRYKVSA